MDIDYWYSLDRYSGFRGVFSFTSFFLESLGMYGEDCYCEVLVEVCGEGSYTLDV